MRRVLIAVALTACSPPATRSTEPNARGFLKGQLHLHSSNSGDSETPPSDVVRWYADAGFDFIVFTDHNRITEQAGAGEIPAFPGVELTQNLPACEPPPEPGLQCLLHVNALFVDPSRTSTVAPPSCNDRVDVFRHAMEVTDALGGLAVLNHPNFHYAADADLLAELAGSGLRFFELANEAVDSNNEGDATHASTEAMWDDVLSRGLRLYGIATDDAHHYYDAESVRANGGVAHVGDRGFVMVRAEPRAVRAALERGDFYASNGLILHDVQIDGTAMRLEAAEDVTFIFIGDGGRTLSTVEGRTASFDLRHTGSSYMRARVVDRHGRNAWTQPLWR